MVITNMKKCLSTLVFLIAIIFCFYALPQFFAKPQNENYFDISVVGSYSKKLEHNGLVSLPPKGELKGYGIRIFGIDGVILNSIETSNDKLECYVSVANINNYTDESALAIFIDGIIQNFSVDGMKLGNYIYFFDMPEYSIRNIPISIEKALIEDKSEHNITFVYINKCQETPQSGICDSFFIAPLSIPLKINDGFNYSYEDKSKTIISDTDKKDVPMFDEEILVSIADIDSKIDLTAQNNLNIPFDEYIRIRVDAHDISENIYKTYIFANGNPLILENQKMYLRWASTPDKIMSYELSINSLENSIRPGSYSLFTISVPEDINKFKGAFESRKFLLNVK
ncbi:hypothetical protein [Acetivibrio clariflavus]|uniref:hypothetical protein n=1 Tax=Acetivibrio clariflavus TaxID=288965 RepID=UPI00048A2CAC|nr:hypothetical protein [Acetivibrio clariflavus]